MFVIKILFIRTFRYRLIFYLVGCLLLNFMIKTKFKNFIERYEGRLRLDDLKVPAESGLGLKICRLT